MILGWSSFKVVQMVPVRCISRSQELKTDFLTKNLKNLLVRNHWTDFNIIFAEMFLWWSSTKIVQAIWIRQKTGRQEAGLIFPMYLYRKLQKSSYQKPLDRFQYNFAEMFLRLSSTKIVQAIWIRQKSWSPGGGAYFPHIIYIENFKNLLVRNHWTNFNIILQKYSFGDPLPRLFKPFGFVRKHGRQGAGLIFPIYLYRKL